MLFPSILTIVATLTTLVSAADYRLLVSKPSCITMSQFADTFLQLCPQYPPAVQEGLTFQAQVFQRGNSTGGNKLDKIKRGYFAHIPMTMVPSLNSHLNSSINSEAR
ncbi:MAG: hypothetical protein TREMPRED_004235 [Tremellales sp. Tagirdzhanova-0007]|nr:MAG: hypothetical protein TREMPRED_004235 [Tremellales sp. Tagirdzhanova-0007]